MRLLRRRPKPAQPVPPIVLTTDPRRVWFIPDADIYRYLCWHLGNHDPATRQDARWVMSGDWHDDLKRRFKVPEPPQWPQLVPAGQPAPEPAPPYVLGIPIDIRDGAGVPHLERTS